MQARADALMQMMDSCDLLDLPSTRGLFTWHKNCRTSAGLTLFLMLSLKFCAGSILTITRSWWAVVDSLNHMVRAPSVLRRHGLSTQITND